MPSLKSPIKWLALTLPVLLCLTGCASLSSGKLKQRVMECRNPPEAAIPDAPADIPAYVPFSVELLGVIALERAMDAEEWDCVEGL